MAGYKTKSATIAALSGVLLGFYSLPAKAINSSQCGGPSILYHDDCGNRIENYHVCLGPGGRNGTINFTINPGGSHALNVPQGSTITGSAPSCGGISNNCPANYAVELQRCAP
jgi:hypothetical protein